MLYEIFVFTVCCLMILIYYRYLLLRTRNAPDSSVHVLNARIRTRWVEMIMNNGNRDMLAIQTLRNSVIASNFMASTSILLIIGALNLSEKIGQWSLKGYFNALDPNASTGLLQFKLGFLLLDFFVAFFCFSMAIRLFNHVGYMINLPDNGASKQNHHKQTCDYLNRGGSYYTLGNRAFFFSLPLILWFLGPYYLMLATLALIAGLAMLDRVH